MDIFIPQSDSQSLIKSYLTITPIFTINWHPILNWIRTDIQSISESFL